MIGANGSLVVSHGDTLIPAVHALQIPARKTDRKKPEYVVGQAGVVARVRHDDDKIRGDESLGINALNRSFQCSKSFRVRWRHC